MLVSMRFVDRMCVTYHLLGAHADNQSRSGLQLDRANSITGWGQQYNQMRPAVQAVQIHT
jgi:hypothetical protein